jgi:excisionase family DNA binding protein
MDKKPKQNPNQAKEPSICDISTKPILTEQEACQFLGCSRRFISNLRAEGRIGYLRSKGGLRQQIRYHRRHLDEYVARNFSEVKPAIIR